MKAFSKNEIFVLTIIFLIVFAFTFQGLMVAKRKSRDAQRRNDLGLINDALENFGEAFGFYPPSEDGKIKACAGNNFEAVMQEMKAKNIFERQRFLDALRPCDWGKDGLSNLVISGRTYLNTLPSDPYSSKGISYLYLSDTKYFQIYSYLEGGVSESGYDEGIVERNLNCGNQICSFGKTIFQIPLNMSIENYEKELEEKLKK